MSVCVFTCVQCFDYFFAIFRNFVQRKFSNVFCCCCFFSKIKNVVDYFDCCCCCCCAMRTAKTCDCAIVCVTHTTKQQCEECDVSMTSNAVRDGRSAVFVISFHFDWNLDFCENEKWFFFPPKKMKKIFGRENLNLNFPAQIFFFFWILKKGFLC